MQLIETSGETQPTLNFIREGFVTLNPAQMGIILRECQYDRQRRVDANHVAVLAELMRRGLWERKDKLDFARLDGCLILVNGYHRASAQLASTKNIEWTIVIHECSTQDAVRALYYKFDTNLRKRSDENILSGVGFADEYGLSKVAASTLFRAAPIIANGLMAGQKKLASQLFARRIMDDRLAIARDFAPFASALTRMLEPAPPVVRDKFRNAAISAVALVTVRHQPVIAADFWGGVAMNDGLRRSDPRATFLADLMGRNFNVGPVQQGILCPSLAWNAFWERRDLKIIKFTQGRKLRLEGTPYTVQS